MMAKSSLLTLLVGVSLFGPGCSTVRGSAVATGPVAAPTGGPVQIVTLAPPAGAIEVGIIQARGRAPIDELAPEFVAQAAHLGAEFAKVDTITTKFELVRYWYSCGTNNSSRCWRTREVATTQMVGRAFRRENR